MPRVRCQICSTEFYVKPAHQKLGYGKFCSIKCRTQSQLKGKFVECSICHKKIYRRLSKISHSTSRKYFCSKSCQTQWRNLKYSGDKSPNWKNGQKAYRNILKRNGIPPTCAICGITDLRILNAHHKNHDRNVNDIHNLIWLCLNCHYLVHHDKNFESKIQ